jgi:hypothetical protein
MSAGFRRLPGAGGLAPRASIRDLFVPGADRNTNVVALMFGLGF